jgi:hypothetical protein
MRNTGRKFGPHFGRDFIKAIDNWMAGSIGKSRKARKITDLLKNENVEDYAKHCDEPCFRRSVLVGPAITNLYFRFYVKEETSSWTTDQAVAVRFKGGPPNPPHPGVIFKRSPRPSEIVLNLGRLFEHERFWPSVEHWEGLGLNVSKGLRRYANQREVILTVDEVPHDQIFAFGSNAAQTWVDGAVQGVSFVGQTKLDFAEITRLFNDFDIPTQRWVFEDRAMHVYAEWLKRVMNRSKIQFRS